MLAACGGIAGSVLSIYGVRYFGVAFDVMEVGGDRATPPYWVNLSMNAPVFAFLAAVSLGSTIAFGLVPALHSSKINVNDALKEGGRSLAGNRRARRWTGWLMVGQLALTLVLLTAGGLMGRSFLAHYRTNLVINTSSLGTARVMLRQEFFDRLTERLRSRPTVASVTLASDGPFLFIPADRRLAIERRTQSANEPAPIVSCIRVGDAYFATVGLRITHGRAFSPHDGEPGRESAIVDQRFVAVHFRDEDPIGARIRLTRPDAPGLPARWLTIVGVVPTLPQFRPAGLEHPPLVYMPIAAEPALLGPILIIVRTQTSATRASLAALLREEVRAIDPDLPVYAIQTVDDRVTRTRFPLRLMGSLFGLLALIAVVLASVGLYALTAQGVAERIQEIGVRMALGAEGRQLIGMFVRRTLIQLGVGLTLGLAGAVWSGNLVQSFFLRSGARDPITIAAVAAFLIIVSLASSILPARRAARVDPVVALRYE